MAVFKRGSVYWMNFWWNGSHVQKSTRQGNPRVARQIEAAFRTQLAKGEVGLEDREPVPALNEFAEKEFEPWVQATFVDKPKTLAYYTNGLRRLAESGLWNLKLDDITGDQIAAYVRKRRETVSVTTINRELQALRRMLKLAEEWGRTGRTAKVRMLPGEQRRDRVLARDEEGVYLAATADEPLKTVVTLLLDTGLRPEEALRLRWEQVNFKTKLVSVTHGKTAAARRSVPMTARTFRMLARRYLKSGRPGSGWVFPAETISGNAEPSTVKKQHARAIRESGVTPFVLYTCRHTFLTRLGESGCDPWTLARIAGHATISISARYVHAGDEAVHRAMKKMQEH